MKKFIILTGPTGVGKTELSLDLAKKLNTEIISADSMQIYRGMNIGTAKILPHEQKNIKHHMIDIIDPGEYFSVDDFYKNSSEVITSLNKENKIPLIVGGTGLYLNSLIYNLDFSGSKTNLKIRNQLEEELSNLGVDYLFQQLKEIDPDSANRIDKKNHRRIIRALEVYLNTGTKFSENKQNLYTEREDIQYKLFVLTRDRENLYHRINNRVDRMIEEGLISEVEQLLSFRSKEISTWEKAIGYKQVLEYLDSNISKEKLISLIKRDSRRYAKRQLTWFRAYKSAHWINMDQYTNAEILMKILNEIKDIN